MFNIKKNTKIIIEKLQLALKKVKEELAIIKFSNKYRISHKEAIEFKKWCLEAYYYKSYKHMNHNS